VNEKERANAMKRILFSATVLMVTFSYNISYSQNIGIDENLITKMGIYIQEMKVIKADSRGMFEPTDNMDETTMELLIYFVQVEDAFDIYESLLSLLNTKKFVDKNKMKLYCEHILNCLLFANLDLDGLQRSIQYRYTIMENKAALNSADKVKRIIKDSRAEIQSTMESLCKTSLCHEMEGCSDLD
jgi:hypothetical protein